MEGVDPVRPVFDDGGHAADAIRRGAVVAFSIRHAGRFEIEPLGV